jgi:hypothetical protein
MHNSITETTHPCEGNDPLRVVFDNRLQPIYNHKSRVIRNVVR